MKREPKTFGSLFHNTLKKAFNHIKIYLITISDIVNIPMVEELLYVAN